MLQITSYKLQKEKGFTLIELLIVVAIIGLLASAVLVGLGGFRARGRDARRIADLRETRKALELYYIKNNKYPELLPPISNPSSMVEQTPVPTTFLRVQGNKIMDGNDNEIFLRGFNDDPFHYLASKETHSTVNQDKISQYNKEYSKHYTTDSDLQEMKAMGANVIRVFISFDRLETEPFKYEESILKTINDFVDRSYKQGIYVIITLSDASESRAAIKTYGETFLLWTDPEFKKRVIAGLSYIAGSLANNPGLAGYDLVNEPEPPSGASLRSFYSEAIAAIRKVDKNHMIILERCHFNPSCSQVEFGGQYEDPNIIFSLHYYNDDYGDMTLESVRYDSKQKIEDTIKSLYGQPETRGRPLYLGEFSALWIFGEPGLQWTKDMIEIMNQYGMHWTYFMRKYQVPGGTKNGVPYDRGLYRAKEWWLKSLNEEQNKNLEVGEEQMKLLLTTENYEINSGIKKVLEDGLR